MPFASRLLVLAAIAIASAIAGAPVAGAPAGWPETAVRLVAADAAAFAPPDLKRQLVKHRDRLMGGVRQGREAALSLSPQAARAEAVRRARAIAKGIPSRLPFWDVAEEAGAIAAFAAAAYPPPPPATAAPQAPLALATKGTSFLGFGPSSVTDPEKIAGLPLPAGTSREAFDSAITLSTRLLAWAWKSAGGDASISTLYPEAKGPYRVRD